MGPGTSDGGFSKAYMEESRAHLVRGAAITFLVLEIGVVLMRFASRRQIKARLVLDDFMIFPALFFCMALCVIFLVEIEIGGVGRHLDVLLVTKPETIVVFSKFAYPVEELYCVSVIFPKLSILAMYLRIFMERKYRYATYVLAAIIIATGISGVIASLASCKPFSARWHGLKYAQAYCNNTVAYWRWISFPNIITDTVMMILPLPTIWGLQMSTKEKIGLVVTFFAGGMGLVFSIIRFTIFWNVHALTNDGTFISADLAIWTIVEPGMYLIAACLPTLRPLFFKAFGGIRSSKNMSSGARSKTEDVSLQWRSRRIHSRESDEDKMMSVEDEMVGYCSTERSVSQV